MNELTHLDADLLSISTERESGEYTIAVRGELELDSAPELETELSRAQESDADRIVVDLGGLHFIDSTGLRVLLQAERSSRENLNRLYFRRGGAQVERVLQISQIDRELRFLD